MKARGLSTTAVGVMLGHSSGSNVSTALSGVGSRALLFRIADALQIQYNGLALARDSKPKPAPVTSHQSMALEELAESLKDLAQMREVEARVSTALAIARNLGIEIGHPVTNKREAA